MFRALLFFCAAKPGCDVAVAVFRSDKPRPDPAGGGLCDLPNVICPKSIPDSPLDGPRLHPAPYDEGGRNKPYQV